MEIVIVTFSRDFSYLQYCLKSIDKFARGFEVVTILIPVNDLSLLLGLATEWNIKTPIRIKTMDEWQGAGFLHHMYMVMTTDQWRSGNSPYCAHIDADCVFVEPVTPDDYMRDDKPILRYEEFDTLCSRCQDYRVWQTCTSMCLPFPVIYETMRAHPAVYHISTYAKSRERMREKTSEQVDSYIRRQRNSFPQTFCEFVTLGNVVIHDQRDKYSLVRQNGDAPDPPNKLIQFHAPDPINHQQLTWIKGKRIMLVPLNVIHNLGIT